MSNVINFNAREFKLDASCESNVGSRMIVTDVNGGNIEIFEIGDWHWAWTQIKCTKQLEPNTDYIFRFAMTGGINDTNDAVSQFIIYSDENWEDRYVYPLDKSRFKPVLSKRGEGGLLRVYEVPFNSGESGNISFILVAQHAVARFMPALDNEAYSEMEDLTYEQLWNERIKPIDKPEVTVDDGNYDSDNGSIDLSGAVMSRSTLNAILERAKFGCNIDLSGAVISEE